MTYCAPQEDILRTHKLERVVGALKRCGEGLIQATAQSQGDNTRLDPYFFHAIETNSHHKIDQIALGLMAGWGVSGTIRDATACGSLVSGSRSASEWVGAAMEMPSGRFCMLSKDAQQVALGVTTVRTLGGLGVVVSTYSMFDGRDTLRMQRPW